MDEDNARLREKRLQNKQILVIPPAESLCIIIVNLNTNLWFINNYNIMH